MKKNIFAAILLCLVLIMSAMPALADGSVTYDGDAREFVFEPGSEYSPTDLFTDFKNVMPGDSLTQKVNVKNDASKKVEVKIYMKALGAHPDSEEFLKQLNMTVKQEGTSTLFDAPANETAQLTDWVCLGTFKSGADIDLDVTLNVPIELNNDFQKQIGYLDWKFKVEEYPIPTPSDEPNPSDKPTPTPTGGKPKTGDDFDITLYVTLCAVSAAAIVVVLLIAKKKKNKGAHE